MENSHTACKTVQNVCTPVMHLNPSKFFKLTDVVNNHLLMIFVDSIVCEVLSR